MTLINLIGRVEMDTNLVSVLMSREAQSLLYKYRDHLGEKILKLALDIALKRTKGNWRITDKDIDEAYKKVMSVEKPVKDNSPNPYEDERFCDNCDKDTQHTCYNSGHERDSSGNHQTCLVCKWRCSGLTDKYEPPYVEEGN